MKPDTARMTFTAHLAAQELEHAARDVAEAAGWLEDDGFHGLHLLSITTSIETAREHLAQAQRHCVAVARENMATWQEVGDLLGISRQAAYQRYRRYDP